ncbi:Lpp/OprI family alanine-zipper lipoprotein [Psychromonas antarctica]|jgi:murein lipoprotein|uniref:Lpp/OprI family alanine-zipper lipoprotein n=1 Tax=Psychromonas antarctica TaxID=67573 RepID=UPI0023AF33A1|nr:Lpp/OprI family alanine-zipper lipoprotein [Psychromonas antarctica]
MKKLLIAGVIVTSALLSGCSNNVELQKSVSTLTNQVSELSAKVDNLASDHKMMKADTKAAAASAKTAAMEAARANTRIDNIAASYKK